LALLLVRVPKSSQRVPATTSCGQILLDPQGEIAYTPALKKGLLIISSHQKGFDFLGYHFEPGVLKPSCQTLKNHAERISRLYEQGAGWNRIRQYVRRWVSWLKAGILTNIQA